MSLGSSFHNTVVESVRFALLENLQICSTFEADKYYLDDYKLTKD